MSIHRWLGKINGNLPPIPAGMQRRLCLSFVLLFVLCSFLASCVKKKVPPPFGFPFPPVISSPLPQVRVALLLPLSAPGNTGEIARAMEQSARMALEEQPDSGISLIIKDTEGLPDKAVGAAQEVIAQRVELILGPLLSSSVAAIAPITRNAGIPVIAFSTDSNLADEGIYLLSFLPQFNIDRVVAYAAGKGKRNIAAFLPDTVQGDLTQTALFASASENAAVIAGVVHYPAGTSVPEEKKSQLLQITKSRKVNAVLFSDSLSTLLSDSLSGLSSSDSGIVLLGSGQWDTPPTPQDTLFAGGLYAAPNPAQWKKFSQDYMDFAGSFPPRIATLSYDATRIAILFSHLFPRGKRFTRENMTSPRSFRGIDGIFRFSRDGLAQYNLIIMEIKADGTRAVLETPPESAVDYVLGETPVAGKIQTDGTFSTEQGEEQGEKSSGSPASPNRSLPVWYNSRAR